MYGISSPPPPPPPHTLRRPRCTCAPLSTACSRPHHRRQAAPLPPTPGPRGFPSPPPPAGTRAPNRSHRMAGTLPAEAEPAPPIPWEMPPDLLDRVVSCVDAEWRGILRATSRDLRAAVVAADRKTGSTGRIRVRHMYGSVELLAWALKQHPSFFDVNAAMLDAAGGCRRNIPRPCPRSPD